METTTNTKPSRVLTTINRGPDGYRIIVTRCYEETNSHTIKTYRARTSAAARRFEFEVHAEVNA